VTFRWYGPYRERFQQVEAYPADVCATFYAECVDMELNECVKVPETWRVPYSLEVQESKSKKMLYEPPGEGFNRAENGLGEYMVIAKSDLYWEGEALTLWSNCTVGCRDCINTKTGFAYRPVELPADCKRTTAGSVFAIWYNDRSGNMDSRKSCVSSLEEYYKDVEENQQRHTIIVVCILAALGLLCIAMVALICWWRKKYNWRLEQTMRGIREQWRQDPASPIGRRQIEDAFPPQQGMQGEPQCVVCLSPITKEQSYRVLQCCHSFHDECIMEWWLREARTELECPVCRHVQAGLSGDPVPSNIAEMVAEAEAAQNLRRFGTASGRGAPAPAQAQRADESYVDERV